MQEYYLKGFVKFTLNETLAGYLFSKHLSIELQSFASDINVDSIMLSSYLFENELTVNSFFVPRSLSVLNPS